MAELVQANWILLVVALVIGLAVAWWIFVANRKTSVMKDEGANNSGPARRNQALIDAPPAAPPPAASLSPESLQTSALDTAQVEPTPVDQVGVSTAGLASPAPAAPAHSAADGGRDDLTLIKGLGPKLQTQLHEMGIFSFAQIAAWDEVDIDRIDAKMGRFQGRIRRDNWVEQARLLQSGERNAYENRFGRT